MLWVDMLHICQQQSLPSRLEDAFVTAASTCDPQLLLRCLLSAAQYGNVQAASIINKVAHDRTYPTKHTALSIAVEYRQEAIAKMLLPTEAAVTKVTTAMSRVIMGDQLSNVDAQIASSKESCFGELTERDIVGRSLVEYCVIFRRTALLKRIIEQIVAFNLDTSLLCTLYHEPVIFLAIREKDIDSVVALYDFCCHHRLDRNIDGQSIYTYSTCTGASAIAQWISKYRSYHTSTQPYSKSSWSGSYLNTNLIVDKRKYASSAKSTGLNTTLSKVSRRSQFGNESEYQHLDDTLTFTISREKAGHSNEKLEPLLSMLLFELDEEVHNGGTSNSMLDPDAHIEAFSLSYSEIVKQLALIDGDQTLQRNIHSLLHVKPMVVNIVRTSSYSIPDASAVIASQDKPQLAELSAVKVYCMHPVFSLNVIVKPPGTTVVQEVLLQSEEVLGLTPFSDPQRFMRLNPLNHDSALVTLRWFLNASIDDITRTFLQCNPLVEATSDQSSLAQLETGADLVMHNSSPYFEAVPPCNIQCEGDNGHPLVLTNFSGGMREIATQLQDEYIFVSDYLILGLTGKYVRNMFKPGWQWRPKDQPTLCTKHASCQHLCPSAIRPVCMYAEIEQLLQYTRRKISSR